MSFVLKNKYTHFIWPRRRSHVYSTRFPVARWWKNGRGFPAGRFCRNCQSGLWYFEWAPGIPLSRRVTFNNFLLSCLVSIRPMMWNSSV